jgi:hypothetical protein
MRGIGRDWVTLRALDIRVGDKRYTVSRSGIIKQLVSSRSIDVAQWDPRGLSIQIARSE